MKILVKDQARIEKPVFLSQPLVESESVRLEFSDIEQKSNRLEIISHFRWKNPRKMRKKKKNRCAKGLERRRAERAEEGRWDANGSKRGKNGPQKKRRKC